MAKSKKKPIAFKREKVTGSGPPDGAPWVWISSELLTSEPWRTRSVNCARLIDFLLREHMAHAGSENGNLIATYEQLAKWGVGRCDIARTIDEAERRGLIVVRHGPRQGYAKSYHSQFRLTWLACKGNDEFGRETWFAATDDWRRAKPPFGKSRKRKRKPSETARPKAEAVTLKVVAGTSM